MVKWRNMYNSYLSLVDILSPPIVVSYFTIPECGSEEWYSWWHSPIYWALPASIQSIAKASQCRSCRRIATSDVRMTLCTCVLKQTDLYWILSCDTGLLNWKQYQYLIYQHLLWFWPLDPTGANWKWGSWRHTSSQIASATRSTTRTN